MRELPEGKTIICGEKQFLFSIASTGSELMKGLGGIDNLGSFDGMLFDFGTNFNIYMWAKGLTFPIDVAFLNENGAVVQFGHLDPDMELSFTLRANTPSRYALEVPVGFFENNNIIINSKFDL